MKDFEQLPASDKEYLQKVHEMLENFGGTPVENADEQDIKWASKTFPAWTRLGLFPFFLVASDETDFYVRTYSEEYLLAWFSIRDVQNTDFFLTGPFLDRGFLPIGRDLGGNPVFLDTNSVDGLEVCLYYFPRLSNPFIDKYLHRTRKSLLPFLEWVWGEPDSFMDIWKRHFSR